ncbi:MAG: energy-coupling factor transporter transmembrane component T [Coriobacteriia bacterium]|nr:energy-coupling factor transporter transmembrane component T [Coriobacteriia bacterium]
MSDFGVYQAGSSLMHRLDPRSKMLGVLLFMIGAFLAQDALGFLVLCAASLGILAASGVSAPQTLRSLKPFAGLIVFVFVFDCLCVVGGEIWWQAGSIGLSSEGLHFACESAVRFVCILLATSVLMRTTSPTELTDATALLCSPLKHIGVKVDDLALGLGMALRFIPSFSEKLQRIRKAQVARGADFSTRDASPAKLVQAQIPTITALFTSAFHRSETLSLAIANREYGVTSDRTCFRGYKLGPNDMAALALGAAFLFLCALL